MARIETWLRCNLQSMVRVQELSGDLFTADNQANRIGVIVTDNNGQPVQLTGGVIGYIIRPDEATVVVNGSINSNRAWIDLPASAYAVKGPISIVIKNGNTTIGACHGYIKRSTTDRIIDPGHEVPSLSELLAEIANMRTATSAANTAAGAANSAAGAANTAATNANNKANAANTAAGAANSAATNANGAAGKINNMTVAASGLAAGSAPTVAVSDVNGHKHILFGIPKGDKGDPGKDFRIKRTFASIAQMEAYDPSQDQSAYKVLEFDYVMIDTGSVSDVDTGKLYCYEPQEQTVWHYIGDLSGTQGIKGETGNGISSVQLNQDYTLTIMFTDGSSVTTASIRGASGNETIDDTAGIGDTDLVYSADKLTKELSQKANGENVYSYKSKSGSIVTVDDAVAEAVKQMWIEIAPVQDLHGYDNPWPAGGGKNLLPMTVAGIKTANSSATWNGNVCVINGITFTILVDGDGNVTGIKANGTASGDATLYIYGTTTSTESNITFSNAMTASDGIVGSQNTYRGIVWGSAGAYIDASEISLESGFVMYGFGVRVMSGASASNIVFYPMIRLSTVTDSAFAPYSNICPISGWTGAKISDTGANIWDEEWDHVYYDVNGQPVSSQASVGCKNYIPVVPGETYYFKVPGSTNSMWIAEYDANKNYLRRYSVNNATITVGDSARYIRFNMPTGYGATYNNDISINYPATNTEYHAYTGATYSITFPSSAGTVYGGTLTVNKDGSGELVVDKGGVDLGSLTWIYNSVSGHERFIETTTIPNIKYETNVSKHNNIICEMYPEATGGDIYNHIADKSVGLNDIGQVVIYDSSAGTNAETFKTAMSGVHLVYELATPATYTLTAPEIITLLSGLNNVWSDTSDILSMLYAVQKGYSKDESDERYAGIIEGAASGSVATFNDGADDVPMKVVASIEPVQDLHGYDNPWPAGGSKNIFPLTVAGIKALNTNGTWNGNVYTIDTVVFTLETEDGISVSAIKVTGTNTSARRDLVLPVPDLTGLSNFCISVFTSTGNGGNRFQLYGGTGTERGFYLGDQSQNSYPVDGTYTTCVLNAYTITGSYNSTYKFMIEGGTTPSASFVPYSNICPITGWTGAKVTRTGKNLLDCTEEGAVPDFVYHFTNLVRTSNSIQYKSDGAWAALRLYRKLKPGTYTTSIQRMEASDGGYIGLSLYNYNTGAIISYAFNNVTFTITEDTIIEIRFQGSNGTSSDRTVTYEGIQIEIGSTATAYEPYTGTTYPITFQSEAGTVYGGTLAVNKDGRGSLVVDRITDTIDENTTIVGNVVLERTNTVRSVFTGFANKKPNATTACKIMSNIATYSPDYVYYYDIIGISEAKGATDRNFQVGAPKSVLSAYTANGVKAWLENNPIQIVYYLDTPVTYSLTPGQVKTLLGVNNIWADTGNILSVDYPADTKLYIDKKFAELQALILENISNT